MALKRIALRDFVIVQALDLDLHAGFTVLTGETGAGKSILIDALQLVLGGRGRRGARRRPRPTSPPSSTAAPLLPVAGRRRLCPGRQPAAAPSSTPRAAAAPGSTARRPPPPVAPPGRALLDIHGQHAWQSLTRPDAVRELLDAYAGVDTQSLRAHWTPGVPHTRTWNMPWPPRTRCSANANACSGRLASWTSSARRR
jgi:DNA repair protein RecN (Recombination protein N)